jgi:hypothetical protein
MARLAGGYEKKAKTSRPDIHSKSKSSKHKKSKNYHKEYRGQGR